MADKQANLIINLVDKASSGLAGVRNSILGASAAVAGLTAFLASSLKEFAAQEQAVNKLNVALKNQGTFTRAVSKDLVEYASELQRTTAFADEEIIATEGLLTTFGLAGDQLKKTTKAALDLSTGLGIDLRTATLILGKAFTGETGTLSRFGIKISDTIPPSEKFAAVMDQVNQRFGGSAQANLGTVAGKLENLKNRFSDLKEMVGEQLVPAFEFWTGALEKAFTWVEKLTNARLADMSANDAAIAQLTKERDFLLEIQANRAVIHEELTLQQQARLEQIDRLLLALDTIHQQEITQGNQKVAAVQTVIAKTSALEKAEIDARIKRAITFGQWQDKNRAEGYKAFLANEEEMRKQDLETQKNREVLEERRRQSLLSTLNFISSLSTSKNKELAAIGKAAALAQAYISTFQAANIALASAPPPFNFALAAAVVAAGLANVAKIAGVQLARGGIVLPQSGGTLATLGEAGQAEAVIPLGSNRATDELRDSGIGTTINIQVGTVVGSDGMREFAKIIDRELFSLRRNNESVAFETI